MQNNIEDLFNGNKVGDKDIQPMDHISAMNGSNLSTPSVTHENSQTNVKTYRLIIQIDKIRGKPGPKCKKVLPLIKFNNTKDAETNESDTVKKRPLQNIDLSPIKKPCAQGTCKLKKCTLKSKLEFQCELCDKYYIAKTEEAKNFSCTKCFKSFSDSQSLYAHAKTHFGCDICLTECTTQMTYDKHIRLHVSTDPQYPYKCHQCHKIFEMKEGVKQHCLVEHPKIALQNTTIQVSPSLTKIAPKQNDNYFCINCNIGFTSDQAYRTHINSHGKKEGFTCNITNEASNIIAVPNPLTGNQIGILQPVKFSCRVCSKQFDNFDEVNLHTRTHLQESGEELKCNICKKSFKNNAEFSEHLKHHLSRAHPCPICSKAFINKTTLNTHLKTHSASVK
ncbi:zinc finger protein 569 isoform X1 [Monomorium pharaonis]|uniref:zinc finger protein 569 isoform X1 n=1 Tax=Monomorium pharaonis TaxID=307658 RepID=UPI00063ED94A|nr:zinc finger protein 569 isoform X1 [Monomorium pharaonis]XP_036146566.1 zinc finger protein 569 isoform X1 [Monomorium pharaonis]XP_036146602.1 zinc finger protein 569 isoform X1 [Monomorium pharaonis]